MNRISTLKFSESGVRGIVGEGLTARLGRRSRRGVRFLSGRRPHCGRARYAFDRGMFEQAVTAGLLAAGCEVLRVGVIPTPTLQYTVKSTEAAAARHHGQPQPAAVECAQIHRRAPERFSLPARRPDCSICTIREICRTAPKATTAESGSCRTRFRCMRNGSSR